MINGHDGKDDDDDDDESRLVVDASYGGMLLAGLHKAACGSFS